MVESKSRVKRKIKILVFLVSLLFSIFVAEIVGRLFGLLPERPSEQYVRLTQNVGRLPAPLSTSRFTEPNEFDTRLEFNELGFRDRKVDFQGSSKKRILAVGDSFVTAWEVPLDQRWTEQMHRLRPDWSILNVGMRNWGIDQTYLNLVYYPLKINPDIVLLMFFTGNDVSDNFRPGILKSEWDAPHFVPLNESVNHFKDLQKVDWSGFKDPFDEPKRLSFPRNIHSWLRLHSVVYRAIDLSRQFLQERAMGLLDDSRPKDNTEPPVTWEVFRVGDDPPEWQTAWQITEVLLLEMKAVSERRNAQFMIVIVPYSPLIEPETAIQQENRKVLLDSKKYNLEKPAKRLIDFGQRNGIPVLDLAHGLKALRKEIPDEKRLFFPKDGHFTALGNCVVANLIVQWIDPYFKMDSKGCL